MSDDELRAIYEYLSAPAPDLSWRGAVMSAGRHTRPPTDG
jgi:hypothetical protein